jgi:hypothetical protein
VCITAAAWNGAHFGSEESSIRGVVFINLGTAYDAARLDVTSDMATVLAAGMLEAPTPADRATHRAQNKTRELNNTSLQVVSMMNLHKHARGATRCATVFQGRQDSAAALSTMFAQAKLG